MGSSVFFSDLSISPPKMQIHANTNHLEDASSYRRMKSTL